MVEELQIETSVAQKHGILAKVKRADACHLCISQTWF